MLTNGSRRRGFNGLSQATATPVKADVHHPTAIEDVFNSANRVLERVDEVFELAQSGYNLDVAKNILVGGGGAQEWMDQAFNYLKQAKAQNQVSADEASMIALEILKPISNQMSEAFNQVVRGKDPILNYWAAYKNAVASIVQSTVGFFGQRWKITVDSYRDLVNTIKASEAALAEVMSGTVSAAAIADLDGVKIAIANLKTIQATLEASFKSQGLSVESIQKEAGLGILPLIGALVGVGGAKVVTVGSILTAVLSTIVTGVIAAMGWTLYSEGSLVPSWLKTKATLFQEAVDRAKTETAISNELQRQKDLAAKAKDETNKTKIDASLKVAIDASKNYAERLPQIGITPGQVEDKVRSYEKKYGVHSDYEMGITPSQYALVIGLGLGAAFIYYLWKRNR